MIELAKLTRLNLRGTGLHEVNMGHLPYLEDLNCADNCLRSLLLQEGPIQSVMAANNSRQYSIHIMQNCAVKFM